MYVCINDFNDYKKIFCFKFYVIANKKEKKRERRKKRKEKKRKEKRRKVIF